MRFQKALMTLPPVTVLVAVLSGCATAGLIYEDVGHPPMHVIPNSEGTAIGWDPNLNASMGGRELVKKGVSCSQDILKLVAWGDGTQAAAAKQGGITEVVGLDFDNTAILGFIWTRNCTIVYGREVPVPAAPLPPAEVSPAPAEPVPAPAAPEPVMTAPAATTPSEAPPVTAAPPAPVPPAPTN